MTDTFVSRRLSPSEFVARVKAWLADRSDRSAAQRFAGLAFVIRVANAGLLYVTQILLARWMGRFEFGIYAYVWTCVGLVGSLALLGVAFSAPRFISEYRTRGDGAGLRGFLVGGRLLCFALGTTAAIMLAAAIALFRQDIAPYYVVPFFIACLVLPIFAISAAQDTIARSSNWTELALLPGFVVLPLTVLGVTLGLHLSGVEVSAVTTLATAGGAMWIITLVQLVLLNRRLAKSVPPGPRRYEAAKWLRTALPIFMNESCFLLLTFSDILLLQLFVSPADLAVYYAATKTLAVVTFIYYAVGAASGHRFSEYHVAGDRAKLASFVSDTVRWTFWPSLAIAVAVVAVGKPILSLFGPGFEQGYALMCIVAFGLLARAALGPAERLLNMVGEQRVCTLVYASALVTGVTMCLILIPRLGLIGAAIGNVTAVLVESTLLFIVTKQRLGLHVFPFWRPAGERPADDASAGPPAAAGH